MQKHLESLTNLLEVGNFVLISGDNPLVAGPQVIDKPNNEQLYSALVELGYSPIRAQGFYGGVIEASMLVPDISLELAKALGVRFGQESIILVQQGHNCLISIAPNSYSIITGDGYIIFPDCPHTGGWTKLQGFKGYFTLNLDF